MQTEAGTWQVTLEANYRSTQAILDLGNSVLKLMRKRFDKTLTAAFGTRGRKPRLRVFMSSDEESSWIADQVQEAMQAKESLSDYAVLYRNAYLTLSALATTSFLPSTRRNKMPNEAFAF